MAADEAMVEIIARLRELTILFSEADEISTRDRWSTVRSVSPPLCHYPNHTSMKLISYIHCKSNIAI